MIKIHDLTVRYADTVAVDAVSLQVQRGDIVALLGPSGCGKSSLLRAIAGLVPATGTLHIDGHDMTGVPVHQRHVGMVFQEGQLFPHRNVAGNISYGLSTMSKAQKRERVSELLELVGLAGYEDRPISTLSGGQAQRVALARSLAPQPGVLLLDEPLSALDRSLRERLSRELRDIIQAAGVTAIYVTHDQDEAFSVADRVMIMEAGAFIADGTPMELARSTDERVTSFLGTESLVPATVLNGNGSRFEARIDSEFTDEGPFTGGENIMVRLRALGADTGPGDQ